MREFLRGISVALRSLFLISVLFIKTVLYIGRRRVPQKIRVKHASLPPLVLSIKNFKDVSANKFVISIEVESVRIFAAILCACEKDVSQCSLSLFVIDPNCFILWDLIEFLISFEKFLRSISRGVLHNYNFVI